MILLLIFNSCFMMIKYNICDKKYVKDLLYDFLYYLLL